MAKNEEPYDAGDTKSVKKAKKNAKFIEEKFKNGMYKICNDPDTRFVLARFLDETRVFHPDRIIQTVDHQFEHGRDAGMRQAGLWWQSNALLHDPDILGKLAKDDLSILNTEKE